MQIPLATASGTNPDLRPLSTGQLAIWHAQSIDPSNPIFNQAEYVEIRGSIDTNLFA